MNSHPIINRVWLIALLIVVFYPTVGQSENLGVYGAIYPIVEPDMLTAIHNKLELMQDNGSIEQLQRVFTERVTNHVLRPSPVAGVSDLGGGDPASYLFDPSVRVSHDVFDAFGHRIARQGSLINPLKTIPFNEVLVFLNGDNEKQLVWFNSFIKSSSNHKDQHASIKVILVRGNIRDTVERLHTRVYFDQHGVLSNKFNIKHTPTVITQAYKKDGITKIPQLLVKEYRSV